MTFWTRYWKISKVRNVKKLSEILSFIRNIDILILSLFLLFIQQQDPIPQAFSHFSWQTSGILLICDLQGWGHVMTGDLQGWGHVMTGDCSFFGPCVTFPEGLISILAYFPSNCRSTNSHERWAWLRTRQYGTRGYSLLTKDNTTSKKTT